MPDIIIENEKFVLTIDETCIATSLIHKASGQECLADEKFPLFTVTEPRPFNNNIKLAYPNKRMTFASNRVRREGDRLIVGFELIGAQIAVDLDIKPDYVGFRFAEIVPCESGGLFMDFPPIDEVRFLQLPVKERKNFGEWLNAMWDEEVAVNVLGTSPFVKIDSEKRNDYRILSADALKEVTFKDCHAALIVSDGTSLLDAIDRVEQDYSLPRGAKNRRGEKINRSCYWTGNITPLNVDEHIAYAKRAGLSLMLIYYPAIFETYNSYGYVYTNHYVYRSEYPNGFDDLKAMIKKINDAGITVGFHVLHTHIGLNTEYISPVADHRLRLKEHYTLSRPISAEDTTIYIEESPENAPKYDGCRVLRFGGELITYEGISESLPYCFTGCKRGHLGTVKLNHNMGDIGGVLDISEFCATSTYIDQKTSLQDEVADEIARVYSAGFEFLYYDGSEGANPPFEIYIPLAQYRVYKKLDREPIFCEGAAKAHFSWHMLAGGNAFDAFSTDYFKGGIADHPAAEAPRMANDLTRLNFGWWIFRDDTQPDHFEYGTSRAAAYDCPGTMMENIDLFKCHPRTDDIFEVLRRWEDVRQNGFLTREIKDILKDTSKEHTLLINEDGEYELAECELVRDDDIRAFCFERKNETWFSLWHKTGEAELCIGGGDFSYFDALNEGAIPAKAEGGKTVIEVSKKRYLKTHIPKADAIKILQNATII